MASSEDEAPPPPNPSPTGSGRAHSPPPKKDRRQATVSPISPGVARRNKSDVSGMTKPAPLHGRAKTVGGKERSRHSGHPHQRHGHGHHSPVRRRNSFDHDEQKRESIGDTIPQSGSLRGSRTTTTTTTITVPTTTASFGDDDPQFDNNPRFDDLKDDDDDDDDITAPNRDSGFSPDALLDRYTAEMEHTARQKEAASEIPPPTSLSTASSLFWGSDNKTTTTTTSTSAGMGGSSGSGADLDVSDTYGRPAHMRRTPQPKGGVFGQKERFEHVDQSVNLMAMASEESASDATHSPTATGGGSTSSERRKNRFTRKGRLAPHPDSGGGAKPANRFTTGSGKGNILRTLSKDLTDVFLGNSFHRRRGENLDGSDKSQSELLKDKLEGIDEEEPEIGLGACCICLAFATLLVVVILMLTGVIPMPGAPGATSRSGEDIDMDVSSVLAISPAPSSPKRLHAPVPTMSPGASASSSSSHSMEPHKSHRWWAIQSIIVQGHVSFAKDLEDETSAPHKALHWICDEDPAQLDPLDFTDFAHVELFERFALVVFFYATHDEIEKNSTSLLHREDKEEESTEKKSIEATLRNNPHLLTNDESLGAAFLSTSIKRDTEWHHTTGWMTKAHVCQWYGIQCHRSGRVSSIHLSRNRLAGQLPAELRALRELQHLDLSYNNLRQDIPEVLWDASSSWPDLVTFDVSNNQISGSLPDTLGGFKQLKNFTVDNNLLTGELPRSIGELSNLELFSAQKNYLTGPIRDTSAIAKLRILRLGHNQLQGEFPFHLTRNRNLIELQMNANQLSGTLPPEMDSLNQLKQLKLDSNQFQGPLPDIFGRLHQLQILDLHNNTFGEYHKEPEKPAKLPTSLGALTNLKTLKINTNRFKGGIPEQWWNMKSLEVFHLHDNDLAGSIPEGINKLSRLRDFRVHDSFMSGTVPSQLGECQRLEKLMIYNSKFTGTVPGEICDLRSSRRSNDSTLALVAADCQTALDCSCCDRCYR